MGNGQTMLRESAQVNRKVRVKILLARPRETEAERETDIIKRNLIVAEAQVRSDSKKIESRRGQRIQGLKGY